MSKYFTKYFTVGLGWTTGRYDQPGINQTYPDSPFLTGYQLRLLSGQRKDNGKVIRKEQPHDPK